MRPKSGKMILGEQAVWFKVMSILYRSGNSSMRIPSSNELAAEFGIAPATVRLTFKKLEKEGYLFTRKGSGTFTRPQGPSFSRLKKRPLIGLLVHTGDVFFYPVNLLQEMSVCFQEVAKKCWNIRLIHERCSTPEETKEVIRHAYLDGLICMSVNEGVAEAASELIPTVNMNFKSETVCSIYSKIDHAYEIIRKETAPDKKKLRILSIGKLPEHYPMIQFLLKKKDIDFQNLCGKIHSDEDLKKSLPEKSPDWILINGHFFPAVLHIFEEVYGEEKTRSATWIFRYENCPDPEWKGYFLYADDHVRMNAAVTCLEKLMKDPTEKIPSQGFDFSVKRLPEK